MFDTGTANVPHCVSYKRPTSSLHWTIGGEYADEERTVEEVQRPAMEEPFERSLSSLDQNSPAFPTLQLERVCRDTMKTQGGAVAALKAAPKDEHEKNQTAFNPSTICLREDYLV